MKVPEVRFSSLKHMARSPAHYVAGLSADYDTPSMRIGRVVHAMVLGGKYTVYEADRRGNAWKEFQQAHAGQDIVTGKERDEARRIADAVLRDDVAKPYLIGAKERTLHWETAGRKCRGTLDVIGDDFITDLKTTTDASPWRFRHQVRKMAYGAQLAWYRAGARANGLSVADCYLVAVETDAPYAVTVHRLTEQALELGARQAHAWLEQLLQCESSGHWPGYVQCVQELDLGGDEEWAA